MKKSFIIILILVILLSSMTSCTTEPWVDMVDVLMSGDYESANRKLERIEKNYAYKIDTADYVYEYIENIVSAYENGNTSYETAIKKLHLFDLLDTVLYNLEEGITRVEAIQVSREAFEDGKTLYDQADYYNAYKKFKLVISDDTKCFDEAQEYLLGIVYTFLYKEEYDKAMEAILCVDINGDTIEKISEYAIDLVVRILYYENDTLKADELNRELIQVIIYQHETTRESLKEWSDKFKVVYLKPAYAAVCISYLTDDWNDMVYKLDEADVYIENNKPDPAYTILRSIKISKENIGYFAPRMTKLLSLYIGSGESLVAQEVVNTIFAGMVDDEMVASLVTYIKANMDNQEYLSKIDMTVGR
ncbi:MAG: hypothetical protein WCY62_07570 [Clostridia bacterium]